MAAAILTQSRLKELLHYDPGTGIFTWKIQRGKAQVGLEAGTLSHGYIRIAIDGKSYAAHRLAFLYMKGSFPIDQVDHINGRRSDNKWSNFRQVDNKVNQQNQRNAHLNNRTGYLGVTFQAGYYVARIRHEGKKKYLGKFLDAESAHKAYVEAKRKLHQGCQI